MTSETIPYFTPVGNGIMSKTDLCLTYQGDRIKCTFGFNRALIDEVKSMDGAKWHGFEDENTKFWSIANSERNKFTLNYLRWLAKPKKYRDENPQLDPYYFWKKPMIEFKSRRPLYKHQIEMAQFFINKHFCEAACEMGTGKTLAFIEAAEAVLPVYRDIHECTLDDNDLIWYLGPKAGVKAVERELDKWQAKFTPRMMTYEQLVKVVETWDPNRPVPFFLVVDEASKIKNHTAKRSKAVRHVADAMRMTHGVMSYVILLTGTPAPKSPVDWWHQIEVIQPGYLKEGHPDKLKKRLCLIEQAEGIDGVRYPRILTWYDDARKCKTCGQYIDDQLHIRTYGAVPGKADKPDAPHVFAPSVNEVAKLYKRLENVVLVRFKKDCLDLPEKQYQIIKLPPTPNMVKMAKMIEARTAGVLKRLELFRELADGFQYQDTPSGEETCDCCHGVGTVEDHVPIGDPDAPDVTYEKATLSCPHCGGKGKQTTYNRTLSVIGSPKDDYFRTDLDEHEEIGRYIVWGGFTGTIDRLVQMAHQEGWATLRVDGRGYHGESYDGQSIDSDTLLSAMDASHPRRKELEAQYPKVCFVGHPKAGGMALTLTASPTALYYSNSFDGEARMQSEDRHHRAGMDTNRGCVIKDLLVLSTDKKVLDNLRGKKRLQNMSLGEVTLEDGER